MAVSPRSQIVKRKQTGTSSMTRWHSQRLCSHTSTCFHHSDLIMIETLTQVTSASEVNVVKRAKAASRKQICRAVSLATAS